MGAEFLWAGQAVGLARIVTRPLGAGSGSKDVEHAVAELFGGFQSIAEI